MILSNINLYNNSNVLKDDFYFYKYCDILNTGFGEILF